MRFACLIGLLLVPSLALAQVPNRLGYQGRLLKADGTAETGTPEVTFAVFAAETGGTELWSEKQTVPLTEGFYSVFLGDKTPLPANLFDGTSRFLEVSVGGKTLAPRQEIASVAYAIAATSAKNVTGGVVTASSVSVAGNTVIDTTGKIAASSIGSGTLDPARLPANLDATTLGGKPASAYALSQGASQAAIGGLVEGEATVAQPVGLNKADATASGGNVRFAEAVGAATGDMFLANVGSAGRLGVGATTATFRLKVTNNTVQTTTRLATISCGSTRGTATSSTTRDITTGDFKAGLAWQTYTLRCNFQPDDTDQFVAVTNFKNGITDLALDFVQLTPASDYALPVGMVAMFAVACPSGWTEYTAMRGRFPRGEATGNTASLDTGGSDDAIVVAHTHGVSDPGHRHNIWTRNDDFNCSGDQAGLWGVARCPDNPGYQWRSDMFDAQATTTGITLQSTGSSGVNANLPKYQEMIFCVKQ